MEKAIQILQVVGTCIEDDAGSEILYKARHAALARLLVELLGTDNAAELTNQLTTEIRLVSQK